MKNIDKAEELGKKKEFSMRSCWECNPSHEHLKEVGGLFTCFDCGRWYMNGGYFDNEEHCSAEFKEKKSLKTVCITKDSKKDKPYTLHIVRRSCSCEKNWAIDTNNYIEEHEPFVCCKCSGFVTIDQIPDGMKFKERLGTD